MAKKSAFPSSALLSLRVFHLDFNFLHLYSHNSPLKAVTFPLFLLPPQYLRATE